MKAAQVGGAEDSDVGIQEAIQLLKQALAILDKCHAPPEIGARLEEIIGDAQGVV